MNGGSNWMRNAAVDIASKWPNATPQELIGICAFIQALIIQHCPFEMRRAYMPVPRCDSCKHWQKIAHHGDGICAMFTEHADMGVYRGYETDIVTLPDFGCVEWKAK